MLIPTVGLNVNIAPVKVEIIYLYNKFINAQDS